MVRAKRLRRADPAEQGNDSGIQLGAVGIDDDAAYKILEEKTVTAVHNLKNLYAYFWPYFGPTQANLNILCYCWSPYFSITYCQ